MPYGKNVRKIRAMEYAPIALFVYRRPEETRQVLDALRDNEGADKSGLFVFSDGPKNEEERKKVGEVRALFRDLAGFASVTVREQETNRGLAASVIAGVTEILRDHDRVIVLEDDLVTSKYFLRFMNEALEKYRDDDRICCIHGFSPPTAYPDISCFLRPGADCWGWATWRRGWELFRPDARQLYDEIVEKNLRKAFDRDGAFPYTKMLAEQAAGRLDSWAVRWYASAFLAQKYTLQSNRMLVENIGFGGSATHCSGRQAFRVRLAGGPVPLDRPADFETPELRSEYKKYMKSFRRSLWTRTVEKIGSILRRIGAK